MTSKSNYRVESKTMAVSDILRSGTFEVPWHQREFDWEDEHVEQFWNDIQESMEKGEEDYFVGSIVLTREEDRQFSIQDGQQRLTTYSIMIAVLRTKLPERYENDAQRITRSIPQNRIPTGKEDTRIRHQEHERSKYSAIIDGGRLHPNGKLTKARNLLHDKADEMITQYGLEEVEKLFNYLVESVIAIRVINKPENATQIFESLNDRGKRLSQVDLIRNYLYSFLKGTRGDLQEEVHRNLETMRREAGHRSEKRLELYVRCALQCRYDPIRKNHLYQESKEAIEKAVKNQNDDEALQTVAEITRYLCNNRNIEAFNAMCDGDAEGTSVKAFVNQSGTQASTRNAQDYVRELKTYDVTLPVTFAILSKFLNADEGQKREIATEGSKVMQTLDALVVRTAAVQTSFAPTKLEAPIAGWGKIIMNWQGRGTAVDLNQAMKGMDPEQIWDDTNFQQKLVNAKMSTSKAKRILHPLYKYKQTDIADESFLTVEHILPKSLGHLKGWPKFNEDNHERYAYALGNMTLLSPSDNKGARGYNESFGRKKRTLQNSTIQANKDIAAKGEWTPDTIMNRQNQLAEVACEVWKPHV